MSLRSKIAAAADLIRKEGLVEAEYAVVLGTGLGRLIDEIQVEKVLDYDAIPGFSIPTVESHDGRMVYGTLEGISLLALDGRLHYYEGYGMDDITFPIHVLKHLGIKGLFISNAAGNLNPEWNKGDIMLLDDHINLLPENPLRGRNEEELGPRWPDMFEPYDAGLNNMLIEASNSTELNLRQGIYVAVQGPNLETRAEYRMLRGIGADAVGMSTVPEVIVANYLDLPVAVLSVLTDDCDPARLGRVDIKDIMEVASRSEQDMIMLLRTCFKKLNS